MKAARDHGRGMGIEAQVITIAFWLAGLMALFQLMPATGYIWQARWGGPQRGDRHVS